MMNSIVPMDPDRPGDLSVIVQGGLSEATLVPIANALDHWRVLFPAAEIVLALSGTDILAVPVGEGELIRSPALLPAVGSDTQAAAALARIVRAANRIALDASGPPLPPIKADTTLPNNVNLQIAAARAGLGHATGRYVLRVRHDLLFLDRSFLDQYVEMAALPRGEAASLRQRVLISWLYTLNPYGLERLPFHFSDWFHFGLREDVAALWQVPFMTLANAVHHYAYLHPIGANARERLFHMPLADEQHLAWHALGARRDHTPAPGPASAAFSLAVLVDDFALCDLAAARCVFPKYQAELHNPEKRHACITPGDWRRLVAARHAPPALILSEKTARGIAGIAAERRQSFPRRYAPPRLGTEIGTITGAGTTSGPVIAADRPGTVVIGPYAALPPGRYRARLEAVGWEGAGAVTLRATLGAGRTVLAERTFPADAATGPILELAFAIVTNDAADFELVCVADGLRLLAISALVVVRNGDAPRDASLPRLLRPATAIAALRCGRYRLALDARVLAGGEIELSVVGADGTLITRTGVTVDAGGSSDPAQLAFDVVTPTASPVTLSCRADPGVLELHHLLVARRLDESGLPVVPRFFDVLDLSTSVARCEDDLLIGAGDGVICYGPYAVLPAGRYQARVHLQGPFAAGRLRVAVTAHSGASTLAQVDMIAGRMPPPIAFELAETTAGIEVVCTGRRVSRLAISGISLEPR